MARNRRRSRSCRDEDGPGQRRRAAPAPPPPADASTGNWADLPDSLLLSVIDRLPCLRDLFAVAAVCSSWRAVARSTPLSSASVYYPPLLLCAADGNRHHRDRRWFDRSRFRRWKLISPVGSSVLSRPIVTPPRLRRSFLGSAYGQLIVYGDQGIIVADIFTGRELRPPVFPGTLQDVSYATVTCPPTHPGCNLLLCCLHRIFRWRVEGSAWEACELESAVFPIHQIVAFKDEVFGLSKDDRLYAIKLSPCFSVKKLAVQGPEEIFGTFTYGLFLVECGSELMLLRVVFEEMIHRKAILYRLSLSGQPEWVKVDSLGDWALFIDDPGKTAKACAHPGRWGGRSNCIYYAGADDEWSEYLLDESIDDATIVSWPSPIWVYPSTAY